MPWPPPESLLLQLDLCFQQIMEAGGEDIELVRFSQPFVGTDGYEEAGLVVRDGRLTSKLNELAKGVAANRRPKPLAHQPFKLIPSRCALILFQKSEPLCSVSRHVEGRQEHLSGILGGLTPKELAAPVQLGERVILAIVRRKE
jgi:hypothetical protein